MSSLETRLFINGEFVAGEGAEETAFDPARGTELARVASASEGQIDTAVQSAYRAFQRWRRTTPKERSRMLWAVADKIEENAARLAEVESLNAGKPLDRGLVDGLCGVDARLDVANQAQELIEL